MQNSFGEEGCSELRFCSDLACERKRADTDIAGVDFSKDISGDYVWERIRISSEEGARSLGRPQGSYDTLTLPRLDTLDGEQIDDGAEEIAKELCILFDNAGIDPRRILVAGLGNPRLTPDSIGPETASRVNATMHIRKFDTGMFRGLDCSEIAVIAPGVMAESGMEARDVIGAICDRIEPDAVIAIDALASRSPMRLGRTIQLSDTGIFPGSGIGNSRSAISESTIGIPVIAIGVPTVISAEVFMSCERCADKSSDYESILSRRQREEMFVSPKEIDGIIASSAKVIAYGINQAFGIQSW